MGTRYPCHSIQLGYIVFQVTQARSNIAMESLTTLIYLHIGKMMRLDAMCETK